MTDGSTRHTPLAKRGRGRPVGSSVVADRDQIIAAAIRAVRREGPQVTMDGIAAEAGVTKPVVYRAVGDKEAVATAVAEDLSQRVESMTQEVIRTEPSSSGRFRITVRNYFEMLRDERQLFLFVEYGWGSHDGLQLETMIERSAAPLIENPVRFIEPTEFSYATRRTDAYATVGALRTVAVMWVRDPYCDLEQITNDVVEYVFRPQRGSSPAS